MWKKFVAFMLLFALTIGANATVDAYENSTYNLTDGKTDLTYTVNINDGRVNVSLSGETVGTTYVTNVDACSVYGDIITLYSVDSLNSGFTVFFFDFLNDSIDSVAINTDAFFNSNCFASDQRGSVYFVPANDTSKLCIYENGNINEVKFKFQITQLLCVDGENVIVVTTKYTYLYNGTEAVKVLDSPLSVPVYYTGGGILKDLSGTEYIYEDGKIDEKSAYTEAVSTRNIAEPLTQNGVYVAETGITVNEIKKAFSGPEVTEVRKADGRILESGKVGTGATVTLSTGETVTVIIYGELTGEGNINSRDLKAILNHLSEKELLCYPADLAADIDKDGKITTKDALKISQMY